MPEFLRKYLEEQKRKKDFRKKIQWPTPLKISKKSHFEISSSEDLSTQFSQFETYYFTRLDNQEKLAIDYIDHLHDTLTQMKTDIIKNFESEREESQRQFSIMRDRFCLSTKSNLNSAQPMTTGEEGPITSRSSSTEVDALKRQIEQLKSQLSEYSSSEKEKPSKGSMALLTSGNYKRDAISSSELLPSPRKLKSEGIAKVRLKSTNKE